MVNYRLRILTAMERSSARKTLEMPYALGSDNTKVLDEKEGKEGEERGRDKRQER